MKRLTLDSECDDEIVFDGEVKGLEQCIVGVRPADGAVGAYLPEQLLHFVAVE